MPFFIMGCRRSGTTLVGQLLNSHSRLAVYHETNYYPIFYPGLRYYGDLEDGRNLRYFVDDVRRILHVQGTEPPDASDLILEATSSSLPGVLAGLLRLYALGQGKERGGDKTPEHYQYLSRIQKDLPQSPVVFIVRDPRDTAASIRRTFNNSIEEAVRSWNEAYAAFRNAVRPVHLVRYEDLVAMPSDTLGGICRFLGESFEEGMFQFYQHVPESFRPLRGAENIFRPINRSAVGRFRELAAEDVVTIEGGCAEGMEALGYRFAHSSSVAEASAKSEGTGGLPDSLTKVLERLRFYGVRRDRWKRGWARWSLMLRLLLRYGLILRPLGRTGQRR